MINVTDRARERLKEVRDSQVERVDATLRLGPTRQGELGVFPDTAKLGDQVVERDGAPVLLIAPDLALKLAGATIDYEQQGESARFTLRR